MRISGFILALFGLPGALLLGPTLPANLYWAMQATCRLDYNVDWPQSL